LKPCAEQKKPNVPAVVNFRHFVSPKPTLMPGSVVVCVFGCALCVAVITNFTPVYRENYSIRLPSAGRWREILNTDADIYGGSGKGNGGRVQAVDAGGEISCSITLPPLATIMLEPEN